MKLLALDQSYVIEKTNFKHRGTGFLHRGSGLICAFHLKENDGLFYVLTSVEACRLQQTNVRGSTANLTPANHNQLLIYYEIEH